MHVVGEKILHDSELETLVGEPLNQLRDRVPLILCLPSKIMWVFNYFVFNHIKDIKNSKYSHVLLLTGELAGLKLRFGVDKVT